ncbi:MAG TPA: OmpH family outer membrane protein [Gemmataceae bacterium]|nr:OmpH family outer membrane protein [Gemmataceae bacterium]
MNARGNWIKAAGLIVFGILIGWAMPGQEASAAKEKKKLSPPRIGYVNVARTLRDFQSANEAGAKITKRRQEFVAQVNEKRDAVAKLNKEFDEAKGDEAKGGLKLRIEAIELEIKKVDADAQKELTETSNETIVLVYHQIKTVIRELAEDRGLDVVECFPAASRLEDDNLPQVAQLMLQTAALMPFYVRDEFDLTQDVIDRLNKKYPGNK